MLPLVLKKIQETAIVSAQLLLRGTVIHLVIGRDLDAYQLNLHRAKLTPGLSIS